MTRALVAMLACMALALGAAGASATPAQQLADASAGWLTETTGTQVTTRPVVAVPREPSRPVAWSYSASSAGGARIEAERWLWRDWQGWGNGSLYSEQVAIHVLIHEQLHRHRASVLEEGATDALALDLLPAWSAHFLGTTAFLDGYGRSARDASYPGQVRLVRALSAAATGASWRSWQARRWRVRLWAADDASRTAMVTEAHAKTR